MLFLSRGGVEWRVQEAALRKAEKHRIEDREWTIKAQAVAIVNQLAKSIK